MRYISRWPGNEASSNLFQGSFARTGCLQHLQYLLAIAPWTLPLLQGYLYRRSYGWHRMNTWDLAKRLDWKPFNIFVYIYIYIYGVCQDCVRKCGSGEEKKKERSREGAACLYIITILTDTVRTLPNNVLDPHHMHVTLSLPALPIGLDPELNMQVTTS